MGCFYRASKNWLTHQEALWPPLICDNSVRVGNIICVHIRLGDETVSMLSNVALDRVNVSHDEL